MARLFEGKQMKKATCFRTIAIALSLLMFFASVDLTALAFLQPTIAGTKVPQ
jgi:hypothetical protein